LSSVLSLDIRDKKRCWFSFFFNVPFFWKELFNTLLWAKV
jgi:hypothetical protein